MVQGINGNNIGPVRSDVRLQEMRALTQCDNQLLASTISSGGKQSGKNGRLGAVKGFFVSIWGNFKWLLGKVFCIHVVRDCFGGRSQKQILEETKKAASDAHKAFQNLNASHEGNRDTLGNSWEKTFDGFSAELKDGLMACYFEALAIGRNKLLEGKDMDDYVNSCFKVEEDRNNALRFLRSLYFDNAVDPCKELPKYFQKIENDCEKKTKDLEKKK